MKKILSFFCLFCVVEWAIAQPSLTRPAAFTVNHPDYNLSPYTGMSRQHWIDAATYILDAAFGYIHTLNDPMKFPKQEGKSYPQNETQLSTEKLEGLSRTLFAATPLLKENPKLVLNHIPVADYYRHQLLNLIRPRSGSFIPHRSPNAGPNQNLVEFGAIAISLTAIPEVLWEPLSVQQRDSIASLMLSYGDGPTVDSNWKFFNIFILSFFKSQGYKVNEDLLLAYLNKSLAAYRGQGWYNDSPAYDYYSMWAFQMYGIYWAHYYGDRYYPGLSQLFRSHFADLSDNYPYLFSRDGKMLMWGRSISYRYAAATVFPFMGFYPDSTLNWGWMRRIASSTMLQFLSHPDFLKDGIPVLGFYGPFEPAVQVYSCRGSVFWSAKLFLGLLIPHDSPFWTNKENEGGWSTMSPDSVYHHFAKESNLLITNYPRIGASEIRAWCHASVASDWQKFRSTENYNRLAYNTAFLWQADGKDGQVAMNYVLKNKQGKWEALRLYDFKKFEDGIYYRKAVLETNPAISFQLADISLPNGILRVDKLENKNDTSIAIPLRLGHYALPGDSDRIVQQQQLIDGKWCYSLSNETYNLYMILLRGFRNMEFGWSKGLNPQHESSVVINATDSFEGKSRFYISLQLWSAKKCPLSPDELMPVRSVKVLENGHKVRVEFSNRTVKFVSFE